jgi:transcriptional regulator with PAS, ATPase and Fis domain
VSVNCAAIPAALLESELFGHVRGAFTGAVRDKQGLFEVARGGTLLLDEVGDMPREMQAKLLRVLQEGAFRRVGDQEERSTDARIVSASLHDLNELVQAKRFREDLFYRLNVVQIQVPPLRQRPEDIPELVRHILGQMDPVPEIVPGALEVLLRRAWPGNVRELHNELQRAVALGGGRITPAALSPEREQRERVPVHGDQTLNVAVAWAERSAIVSALRSTNGSVTQAAQVLGISRVVLHRKIRKHDLRRRPDEGFVAN